MEKSKIRIEGDRGLPLMDALLLARIQNKHFAAELSKVLEIIPTDGCPLKIYERKFHCDITRFTEYHAGVAVIKDKNLLSQAMAKLAMYEDMEEQKYESEECFIPEEDNPYPLCIGCGEGKCIKCQLRTDWKPEDSY